MKKNLTVLERQLQELYETHGIVIPGAAFPYIRKAMVSFGVKSVEDYHKRKRNEMYSVLKRVPKFFFVGYWHFLKLLIRKWSYKLAVRQARLRAKTENYKVYVIQSSDFGYITLSTLDFKHNKSIRVFKKDITAKDMHKTAACVVYPPRRNG